jgi:hypothetical protein
MSVASDVIVGGFGQVGSASLFPSPTGVKAPLRVPLPPWAEARLVTVAVRCPGEVFRLAGSPIRHAAVTFALR